MQIYAWILNHKKQVIFLTFVLITFIIFLTISSFLIFSKSSSTLSNNSSLNTNSVYPLKVSSNNRYLVDQNNKPFFLIGDAGWSLVSQLNEQDMNYYLDKRAEQGFNTILVNLIEHKFADNAPKNFYNESPFTGNNFSTPNEAYFFHVDKMLNYAKSKGIQILLAPLYLGYGCGDEGWCSEVQKASENDLKSWGEFVGNRYKSYDNIIWVIGGDTDPTPVKSKVNSFISGLIQTDSRHLITAHNGPEQMAVDPWNGENWLTLNDVYTYYFTYSMSQEAYDLSSTKPYFLMESAYENEHDKTFKDLRAQEYWNLLSGSTGYVYGNCPIWHFNSTKSYCSENNNWKTYLNSTGSQQMSYAAKFINNFSWQNFIPDIDHNFVISGYGEGENYVMTSVSSDQNTLISFLPEKNTITINMSNLNSPVYVYWFDPTNGKYKLASENPIPNSGNRSFTPDGNNSAGDTDWILVLSKNKD